MLSAPLRIAALALVVALGSATASAQQSPESGVPASSTTTRPRWGLLTVGAVALTMGYVGVVSAAAVEGKLEEGALPVVGAWIALGGDHDEDDFTVSSLKVGYFFGGLFQAAGVIFITFALLLPWRRPQSARAGPAIRPWVTATSAGVGVVGAL